MFTDWLKDLICRIYVSVCYKDQFHKKKLWETAMKPWIRCFYYKDHQWRWWPPFRGSPTTFLDTLGMTTIEVGNVGSEADVSSEVAGAVEAAISGDNGQSLWLEARGCWEPFNSSLLSLFLQRSALASLLRRLLWGLMQGITLRLLLRLRLQTLRQFFKSPFLSWYLHIALSAVHNKYFYIL